MNKPEIYFEEMNELFTALTMNIPAQSIILIKSKNTLLESHFDSFKKIAEEKGIFCPYIDIQNHTDFISQMVKQFEVFLKSVGGKVDTSLIEDVYISIQSFTASFGSLYRSTSLTQSLTELFLSIGKISHKTNTPICFFINDLHKMPERDLGSMLAALHRANQLDYPIAICATAIPEIYKILSNEKPYSERMFLFIEPNA